MKKKNSYQKPQIEVLEIELEEIIATSPNVSITDDTESDIEFRSRRRLWEE